MTTTRILGGGGSIIQTYNNHTPSNSFEFNSNIVSISDTDASSDSDGDGDMVGAIKQSTNNKYKFLIPEPKEEEDASDDIPEHKLCIICLVKKKSTVIADCGHSCACNSCSRELLKTNNKACPICRKEIHIGITQLYE
jgi:hypothetical protein